MSVIYWNPTRGKETTDKKTMSPAVILEHEVAHDRQTKNDTEQYMKDTKTVNESYDNEEEKRVITGPESQTAEALGETPKGYINPNHQGKAIITSDPTSNKVIRYFP